MLLTQGVQLSRGGGTIPPALLSRILYCRTLEGSVASGSSVTPTMISVHGDENLASPRAVADGNGRVSRYISRRIEMGRGFTEAERQIVTALIESQAVNFEALGAALAKYGANATLQLDGEDWFCGTMRRFIRVYRLADNVLPALETLAELRAVSRDIQG